MDERERKQGQGGPPGPGGDDQASPRTGGARQDGPARRPPAHVPDAGLNPEVGDLDAAADPEREADDEALPGRAGGGLAGG